MAAYMRNQFEYYGITAPDQRRLAREALDGLPAPSEAQLAAIARTCWKQTEREWQYFACDYLRCYISIASPSFIETARDLITTKPWWDTVDALAIRTVGPLVRNHPSLVRAMDRWITSDDIWLARTAILHQLTYKASTDPDRLFGYCMERASDAEFFIRKAIGWALRQYSKTDERAVRTFVKTNRAALSGLSAREALKWLERGGRTPPRSKPAKS
jgi:3-methyladenine DNA glycosylase AlkD